jgi:hypothetical protein
MDKELTILVDRLERIFPHLKLYYEGEYFLNDDKPQKNGKKSDIEKLAIEVDFAPPREYDWFDLIKILKKNGLCITNIKDK